jgi:hypothetical protein
MENVTETPEEPKKVPCRHCSEDIAPGAKVCPKCRIHQRPYIGITLTYIPAILVAFAMISLFFAGIQVYETGQKQIEAQDAASRAQEAEIKALEAEERTRQLAGQVDFNSMVVEAFNDSRPAFDRLKRIASDTNNIFSARAKSEMDQIISRLSSSTIGLSSSHWDSGVDRGTITFDTALKRFEATSGGDRLNWISFIGAYNRGDDRGFTTPQRIEFLLKVISEDSSLQDVVYAEYVFRLNIGNSELDKAPLFSPNSYEKWWQFHQDKLPTSN